MSASACPENCIYATLITRSSYLAGVVLLAYTLHKNESRYPLIVLYTDNLPHSSIVALQLEASRTNLVLKQISPLLPRKSLKVNLIAERFADTWTKLRVFELVQYDKVCYLDADMIIRKNMDEIFSVRLPANDWIAANHACVCNLDKDSWAPEEWNKENCAYTPTKHPAALHYPTPVEPGSRPTYHLLNSGMFLYKPSEALWSKMIEFFNTTPKLAEYKFPDQDFLADFFYNKWVSIGWHYNALKTMRYWHPDMWRDEEVSCLHYIVDKPWAKRVGPDGIAGYLGRDGETHRWWWKEFEDWRAERQAQGEDEVLRIVGNHAAKPLGEEGEEDEELKSIGSQVQAFAKKKRGKENERE